MLESLDRIVRGQLPGFERRGCIAQEVYGELVTVTLHTTCVDVEHLNGVAAEVPEDKRKLHPGVSDTILLGSVQNEGRVHLLDILMHSQHSCRGYGWKYRLELLSDLYSQLSDDFCEQYCLAVVHERALMRVFDRVVEDGGAGLLVRTSGYAIGVLCDGR